MPVLFCEYIWIDGAGGMRSKNRILNVHSLKCGDTPSLDQIPVWNFDGSSTGQATTDSSEVILKPMSIFNDPFFTPKLRKDSGTIDTFNQLTKAYLILCETYTVDGQPHQTNTRHIAKQIFDKYVDQEPWYGIEQEFFLFNTKSGRPLGFPTCHQHLPKEQRAYYCGVGGESVFGRDFVIDCYFKCVNAGLKISGMNGEVAPGQWEIQVGPCVGIDAADQVSILRYILKRTSEQYDNISVNFSAKPVLDSNWNGSGGHTNFSTKTMREIPNDGLSAIYSAISKLGEKHKEHIAVYGNDNHLRLTGKCETSDIEKFTYGVGSRSASIRIPTQAVTNQCGYLEDRRPSSSADFYLVTSKILETTMS